MRFSRSAVGNSCAISSALIWSLFPIITSGEIASFSPLLYAALSTLVAALMFALVISVQGSWGELRIRETWRDVFMLALLNGALFHGGVFIGSRLTLPGNTTLLLQMEIFFSVLILRLWGKERLTRREAWGALFMFCGAAVIVWPKDSDFASHIGDLILVACSMIPPVANIFARQAREKMPGMHVIFFRSLLAGPMLLLASPLMNWSTPSGSLSTSVGLVLLNGFLIMGIGKLIWVEAIHRIPISVAVSLGATAPAATLLLTFLFFGTPPNGEQWIALVLVTAGVLCVTYNPRKWLVRP